VGIEATGSMQWFVNLMEELGIECQVGNPAKIRAAEPRKQEHDRRDADLILTLLVENRFPAIWLPSRELQDLRALLRHQWVTDADARTECSASHRPGEWHATRPLSVEPRRTKHDRVVAAGSSYGSLTTPAAKKIAKHQPLTSKNPMKNHCLDWEPKVRNR
jgi:hypothetical protein